MILRINSPRDRLDERLENWAECWRAKLAFTRRGYAGESVENRYRSRAALHWDYDAQVGTAPRVRVGVDPLDAQEVELAVTALDVYHQTLLKGHYVCRWDPDHTLRVAREQSGLGNPRRRGDFAASMAMAKALLAGIIDRPAVIRRGRAAKVAAAALALPGWGEA